MAEFKINAFEDRRKLVAILADNGYTVRVEQRKEKPYTTYPTDSYVIVDEKQGEAHQ